MDLGDLRDSARAKADEEGTGFIDNTQLDRFLNQGLRLVYGKIVQRFEKHFTVRGTAPNGGLISVVADTDAYALPATFQKLVRVERRPTSSTSERDWRRIPKVNDGSPNTEEYWPPREGYSNESLGYYIEGSTIVFTPVPASAFTARLRFVPKAVAMSVESDTPGIPEEYHELVAEYAAIQCLRKSGEGIYKEAMDIFNLELSSMIDTLDYRDQEPEQMVVTDDC